MSAVPKAPPHLDLSKQQGGYLIGVFFSIFLFGVATVQTWYYYQHYPNDKRILRYTVAAMWIFECAHTIFACHAAYWWLAFNFLDPSKFAVSVWSADLTLVFSGLIDFIVHAFFAWRIWVLGRGNPIMPAVIVFVAIGSSAFTFATAGMAFVARDFPNYPKAITPVSTTALALDVLADLLTAVTISYYLHAGRSGLSATDHLINKLIFWCMNVGILTSVIDLLVLIFSEAENNLIFLAIFEVVASAYANSLLATLNIRAIQRSQVLNEDGTSLELTSTTVDFRFGEGSTTIKNQSSKNLAVQRQQISTSATDYGVATKVASDASLGRKKSQPDL